MSEGLPFGAFVRQRREASGVSLRWMAARLGISPTYLSKVERDQLPPPSERVILSLAALIGEDGDALLARGGRIASDLKARIIANPQALAFFIRTLPKDPPRSTLDTTHEKPQASLAKTLGERSQEDH